MSTKKENSEVKKLAELLYMNTEMTQKEIAEYVSRNEHTISRWATEYGWEERKRALILSPDKLIREYYAQAELITKNAKQAERALTTAECDALNKLSSAIAKLDKRVDPSVVMSVFIRYNNYVKAFDLELAKRNALVQRDFIQTLISIRG